MQHSGIAQPGKPTHTCTNRFYINLDVIKKVMAVKVSGGLYTKFALHPCNEQVSYRERTNTTKKGMRWLRWQSGGSLPGGPGFESPSWLHMRSFFTCGTQVL